MDIPPLGVALEPSKYKISFVTASSLTNLKNYFSSVLKVLSYFVHAGVIFQYFQEIIHILVADGI